jgi:hypothetical protein
MIRCGRRVALRAAAIICCASWVPVPSMGCSAHQGGASSAGAFPEETRLAKGESCVRDGDCLSGFCDRGTCAEIGERGNYGRECTAMILSSEPLLRESYVSERDAEGHLSIPGPKAGWRPPENSCGGYPCLDERCRSCQSDSECQGWFSGPRCVSADGFPGKRCGGSAGAGSPGASPAPTPTPAGP